MSTLLLLFFLSLSADVSVIRPKIPAPKPPAHLRDRGVKRMRAIVFDFDRFSSTAAKRFVAAKNQNKDHRVSTSFAFFPNVSIKVDWTNVVQSTNAGEWAWSGSVRGSRYGTATLVIRGNLVTADITRGNGWIYQIRTASDESLWAREVDQKDAPPDHPKNRN